MNSELYRVKPAIEGLVELYSENLAIEFKPLQFKALRVHLMAPPRERSRTYINRLKKYVRKMFKWAASELIWPESVLHELVNGYCVAVDATSGVIVCKLTDLSGLTIFASVHGAGEALIYETLR